MLSVSEARCGLLFPPLVEVDALLVLTFEAVAFELVAPFEEPLVRVDEVLDEEDDDEVVDEDDEVDAESLLILVLLLLRVPLRVAVTFGKFT